MAVVASSIFEQTDGLICARMPCRDDNFDPFTVTMQWSSEESLLISSF